MDNTQTINILSLCTGYGGLELGLAEALEGVFRVVAVERECYPVANLAAKAQEGKLAIEAMWPDLKTFPAERFRGCFDFILAGYPCQPFSVAGKRKGKEDPRHLWPYIARILQAVRPVWCFFENVPGHLTIGYPEVYRSLRDMGYKVEAGIFSAAECGAPHRRERLFILAYDSSQRWPFQQMQPPNLDRCGKEGEPGDQPTLCNSSSRRTRWPSHPGQPQYEWEEPRVVADTKSSQSRQREQEQDYNRQESSITGENGANWQQGQAQSRLGRAVDGPNSRVDETLRNNDECENLQQELLERFRQIECKEEVGQRVDRLRLLGNGVVPQQAEKAFRYLMALFEKVK